MNGIKKFLCLLGAFCMVLTVITPVHAQENNDVFPYQNTTVDGKFIFDFGVTAERPYFRIAVHNTSTSASMIMDVSNVDGELEYPNYSVTIAPQKWNPSVVETSRVQNIRVRLYMSDGSLPNGYISVRVSSRDFSQTLNGNTGSTDNVTSSIEEKLNRNATSQIITWPVLEGYGYWKIAIANTAPVDLSIRILKDSPSGKEIFNDKVSAGSTESFYVGEQTPLSPGAYYILLQSTDGARNLQGTLWYKFSRTYEAIT